MGNLSLKEMRAYDVPPGSLCIWWLGQASYIIKSPAGKLITIDPYLSNSCKADGDRLGMDADRMQPLPMQPEDLVGIDLYVVTHSHLDHMDPDTLGPYRQAGGKGPYIAPPEAWERLQEQIGVPEEEITMTWPNRELRLGDLVLRTTFAIGGAGDDMTHVGYLVGLESGPRFYFTGDTAYEDLLGISVREHKPDVMFTVINGAFRNMGPAEAARLSKMIDPKLVVPCHYDMFPCNSLPPQLLRTNLINLGIGDKYRELEPFKPWTYPET